MPKPTPVLFTQNGYDDLIQELDELQSKRPGYIQELARANELGDRSENEAYKAAKARVRQTDSRIRYLQKMTDRAKVVEATQSEYIEIGSTVVLYNGTKEVTFRIVGGNESDPSKGLLSYQSPLGQGLLNKRVGEKSIVVVPTGSIHYTIISISASIG